MNPEQIEIGRQLAEIAAKVWPDDPEKGFLFRRGESGIPIIEVPHELLAASDDPETETRRQEGLREIKTLLVGVGGDESLCVTRGWGNFKNG